MTKENYKVLDEFASIVLVGYPLSKEDLRQKLKNSGVFKKCGFKEIQPEISSDTNIPEEHKAALLERIPMAVFDSQKHKIAIILLENERKLNLSIRDFDTKKQNITKEIIDALLGFDLSKLSQIGFNFTERVELHVKKLKLLNEQIEKISIGENEVWSKNTAFILTLPFQFDDHLSTYKIQKMVPLKDEGTEKRIYQIEVNQNFSINNNSNLGKNQEAIKVIHRQEDLYCNEFKPMCAEFMKMYYE